MNKGKRVLGWSEWMESYNNTDSQEPGPSLNHHSVSSRDMERERERLCHKPARVTQSTSGCEPPRLPFHASPNRPFRKKATPEAPVAVGKRMTETVGDGGEVEMSCPDYEEVGYCVRGDSCRMKHGSDRIVFDRLDMPILPALLEPPKRKRKGTAAADPVPARGGTCSPSDRSECACAKGDREFASNADAETVKGVDDRNNMTDGDESSMSCPDYESGYCVRGDSCHMMHGSDRIVVHDVQSLIELRLPLNLLSKHIEAEGGSGGIATSSFVEQFCQSSFNSTATILETGSGEVDLYNPDEPHWQEDDVIKRESIFVSANEEEDEEDDEEEEEEKEGFQVSHDMSLDEEKGADASHNVSGISEPTSKEVDNVDFVAWKSVTKVDDSLSENTDIRKCQSMDSSYQRAESCRKEGSVESLKKAKQARSSLCISAIPAAINRKELLLGHFQKFGKLVDICTVPKMSRAFVQFSKREDAESALKSQEAVMGNRFIRISWANRDNVQDPSEEVHSSQFHRQTARQPLLKNSLSVMKRDTIGVSLPVEKAGKAVVFVNEKFRSPFQTSSVAEKREAIELMKEIRRKQMELAKKHNDFSNFGKIRSNS